MRDPVNMAALLSTAFGMTAEQAQFAITRGTVFVGGRCIGLPDSSMQRADLRGQRIELHSGSAIQVSELGNTYRRVTNNSHQGRLC